MAGLKHHQASDIKPTLYTGTLPPVEKRKADYTYTPLIEINYDIETMPCSGDIEIMPEEKNWEDEEWYVDEYYFGFFNYFLFTSQYAVKGFLRIYDFAEFNRERNTDSKIISIGATTTEALLKAGFKENDIIQVDIDNRYGVIEWFKKERPNFVSDDPEWDKEQGFDVVPTVLYPCSSLSPDTIPEALFKMRYNVYKWTVYNNVLPSHPRRVNLNHFKRIVFTSPSTIDHFIQLYGKLPENVEFITRGPVTQAHLDELIIKN